mgnify:CR=1 FL=1
MSRLYKNIVILTGAGISAESGLATFRSSNGLWNNHRVEDVATVEGFQRNPALVHDFYNELKIEIQKAKPNPAHLAITKLQKEYPAPSALSPKTLTPCTKKPEIQISAIFTDKSTRPSALTAAISWKLSAMSILKQPALNAVSAA